MKRFWLLKRCGAMLLCVFVSMIQASEPAFKSVHLPGIHNMFAIGTNIYSGSSPESDEAFAALAKLGVKTIVTVDGAKPNVEAARKHGLRYIHLPHGYDGISSGTQAQLIKAAQSSEGPVLFHCHHGKHRGPAAVAVICRSELGWSAQQAEDWLLAAGTGANYAGLYETARNFHKPTQAQLNAITNLPETAKVSGLIEAMVEVDNRWDNLKAVRAAGYNAPKDSPDIVPANEAVVLWEHYRESQRLPEAKKFADKFAAAELEAKEAEKLLRDFAASPSPTKKVQLDRSFDAIAKSCAACHKAQRDFKGNRLPLE